LNELTVPLHGQMFPSSSLQTLPVCLFQAQIWWSKHLSNSFLIFDGPIKFVLETVKQVNFEHIVSKNILSCKGTLTGCLYTLFSVRSVDGESFHVSWNGYWSKIYASWSIFPHHTILQLLQLYTHFLNQPEIAQSIICMLSFAQFSFYRQKHHYAFPKHFPVIQIDAFLTNPGSQ
jgi:hypothetical protein